MKGALSGVAVLDLTRVLAGPYATMMMADMGAEVIKIEMPGKGDDSRQFGPYINGESAYYMSINRNKKSITMNLKDQKARDIFVEMVRMADVVVENFRPGTMEKLGLGYSDLKKVNPSIILASASGFGQNGPYKSYPAYDGIVQAMGGIMSITGPKGGKPTKVGTSMGDITAGLFTTIGILAALRYRDETDRGQHVDVGMLDCQVAILENAISRYMVTGKSPEPEGNRHSSVTPFETFETSDGEIYIAIGNDKLFETYCQIIGFPELSANEKYKTNSLRFENYDELMNILRKEMLKKSTAEWQDAFNAAGIPNSPINNIEMVINDPQIIERNMLVEVNHSVAGKTKIPGIPIKMSETQGIIEHASPTLGEHTEEVLMNMLGMDKETIEELRQSGAL